VKRIFGILFALALVVSLGLVTAVPVAAQSTVLDHFKCYPASGLEPVEESVYLEDQFGSYEAVVGGAEFFCNPVAMWVEGMPPAPPIVNLDNHLTLYSLDHEEELQDWIVEVENQFETRQMLVSGPVLLGVPTWKLDPGDHDPPVGLDHFLLYKVVVNPFSPCEVVDVGLEDQFLSEDVGVFLAPVYFANPVRKSADGGVTEIENPEAHLVFYGIERGYTLSTEVGVSNQFDEFNSGGDPQQLEVYADESYPALLAVPSEKVSAEPTVCPVRNINTGKGYFTIMEAIYDPETLDGHTIEVAAGEYYPFWVAGRKNISIISTEGATVTTAWPFPDVPVVGSAWVMGAVYNSTNIKIEGINFDGAGVSGASVAVGIAYIDSTGSIDNLRVENVIGTELGAGVAIIGDASTSTVEITRSTISNNDNAGIYVCGGSTLDAHFNSIIDNAQYGLFNDGGEMADATSNWWGHTSGPQNPSNPDGTGDAVSSNVDFMPWLGAETVTQKIIGSGTVDATQQADATVRVTGNTTVSVAKSEVDPTGGLPPTGTEPLGRYIDVYVSDPTEVEEIEIRHYYTDDDVGNISKAAQKYLRLRWWDGKEWRSYSDGGVNTDSTGDYAGYIWGKVRANTEPSLEDLKGTWNEDFLEGPKGLPICFSATVAFGTNAAQKLNILREFRDEVMLPNAFGARLVPLYYRGSPPIASFISQHDVLTRLVRLGFLDPIVKILDWSHDLWSARGP
jgi:hypothetical protein